MIGERKVVAVILTIVAVGLFLSAWYTYYGGEEVKAITELNRQDLFSLSECAPDLVSELDSSFSCSLPNERKHPIVLLAVTPKLPISELRTIYEATTGFASYSQYAEKNSGHIRATTFQTGPWELFCRAKDGHCIHQSPPWEVPYFAKTHYPAFSDVCSHMGFPLMTHDGFIHVIRNPIDSIASWSFVEGTEIVTLAESFAKWHLFWKNYELKNPLLPGLWVRYEDFCLCPFQSMKKIFQFMGMWKSIDQAKLEQAIKKYPCKYSDVGKESMDVIFSDPFILTKTLYQTDWVSKQFGYQEMVKTLSKRNATSEQIMESLWGSKYLDKSPEFCENLLAKKWTWAEVLG